MIARVRRLSVWLTLAWFAGSAQAAVIGPCDDVFAYQSAVNVYVLEDAEREFQLELQDVRKRLAWLVKLDTLFRGSYGSLGVHFLLQPPAEQPCTSDEVVRSALGRLPDGGGATFVDQRVYREGEQILLQSYLRFLRTEGRGQERLETAVLRWDGDMQELSEALPAQRLAFPPRQLTVGDLEEIEGAFQAAARLYEEPDLASPSRELPLSAEEPLPFLVTEALANGWMRIDASVFRGDLSGWLRVDPAVSDSLRRLMPELMFLEGAIGYVSWLQARDGRFLNRERTEQIARRAGGVLARYGESDGAAAGSAAPALGAALRLHMALDDSAAIGALLPSLIDTVQVTTPDSRMRNLLGMARLAACCVANADGEPGTAQVIGLGSAMNDFRAALAIDPGNGRALANIETTYQLLGRIADLRGLAEVPADSSPAVREAYTRAITRLPRNRQELQSRVGAIQALRGAQLLRETPGAEPGHLMPERESREEAPSTRPPRLIPERQLAPERQLQLAPERQ